MFMLTNRKLVQIGRGSGTEVPEEVFAFSQKLETLTATPCFTKDKGGFLRMIGEKVVKLTAMYCLYNFNHHSKKLLFIPGK